MLPRRSPPAALHNDAVSAFDYVTLVAFVVTTAVWTGVLLHHGPVAALHHIGHVAAGLMRDRPPPDATAWRGQMVF